MFGQVKILAKTPDELKLMIEGGKKLARVKNRLSKAVKVGIAASHIENLATELIEKEGGEPSFKKVPGYHWSTCVNINEGVVHGIPKKEVEFSQGDVVSVDVGMYYRGFHTDTSFTVGLGIDKKKKKFLKAGERALNAAIAKARAGARIYDISEAIESNLAPFGYNPVKSLVGHGVGRQLHEEPQIPGITYGERRNSPIIPEGATLAIEVIYSMGSPDIELGRDGWTLSMRDGKISALYEETIAVTKKGTIVLTR
jgi:methionyl aminopeptidase